MAADAQGYDWPTLEKQAAEPFRAEEEAVQASLNRLNEERSDLQAKESSLRDSKLRIDSTLEKLGLNLISGVAFLILGLLGLKGASSLMQLVGAIGANLRGMEVEYIALTAMLCAPSLIFWRYIGLKLEDVGRHMAFGVACVVFLSVSVAVLWKNDAVLISTAMIMGSFAIIATLIGGVVVEKYGILTLKNLQIFLVRRKVAINRKESERFENQRYDIPRRRANAMASAHDRQLTLQRKSEELDRWKAVLKPRINKTEVDV